VEQTEISASMPVHLSLTQRMITVTGSMFSRGFSQVATEQAMSMEY
jgi:hypothetical protein